MSQSIINTMRTVIEDVNHHERTIWAIRELFKEELKATQVQMGKCGDDDEGLADYDDHEQRASAAISNIKAIESVLKMINEVRRTVDYVDVYMYANAPAPKIVPAKGKD